MGNAQYVERVPENVRKADAEKLAGYVTELETLNAQTSNLARFQ